MIKTYAEVLEEEERKKMTNYDMDEIRRQKDREQRAVESGLKITSIKDRKITDTITLGKDEEPWTAIDVEIPDEDFIKLAHAAHTRDITVNKMVNILLKSSMKDLDYRYEHNNKPQLLNEDN